MASPMTWKRRRLNDSYATLSKPFVSPLKTSKTERAPLQQANNAANVSTKPSALAHTPKATGPSTRSTITGSKPLSSNQPKSNPIRKTIILTPSSEDINPIELVAQKALTSLETQIRQLRSEISVLTQGSQLLSSTSNTDLEDLTQKWRLASQTAAEELFGTAKERVDRMGGVAAWREIEKKKYEWSEGLGELGQADEVGDDRDCEFDDEGEELPEEEQEWRKKEKKRMRKEIDEANDIEEDVKAETEEGNERLLLDKGADDHSFTMDMMLRSLNIELGVIGYNQVAQKWII